MLVRSSRAAAALLAFWWTRDCLRVVLRRPACCALWFRASLRARREFGVYVWPRLPQLLVQ